MQNFGGKKVELTGIQEMLRSDIFLISWLQPSNSLLPYGPNKFKVQSNNHNDKNRLSSFFLEVFLFFF